MYLIRFWIFHETFLNKNEIYGLVVGLTSWRGGSNKCHIHNWAFEGSGLTKNMQADVELFQFAPSRQTSDMSNLGVVQVVVVIVAHS